MQENIVLKDFPKSSGVYLIKDVNSKIIYVGSSCSLYQRMKFHRVCIKKGHSPNGYKQDFYQFLQSNQFTVEFQLETNYKQLEQQLIEKYNPKYNSLRAFTGLGAKIGREAEYNKEYHQKFKEEEKQYKKQYYQENKEIISKKEKQYRKENKEVISKRKKQYDNQLCLYSGETLTLNALRRRFKRQGIPHPTLEAKKYLIR